MTSTVSGFVELLAMSSPLPEDWYCVLSDGYVFAHHCVWPVGTVWPSGLRRWLQAPVRKGVGSNPTAVIFHLHVIRMCARTPPLLGLLIHGALLRPLQEVDFMRLVCPPHWVSESHAQHMISFLYLHNTQTLCHGLQSRCQPFDQPHFGKYTWPGSNWRPSACEADVIATRPQVHT